MTDPTPGGWLDAARPGYPKNPELDRWHWMLVAEGEPPVAVLWYKQMWHMGYIGMPAWVFANARYLGPCNTPAEVSALVEAAKHGQHLIDTAREWGRADDDAEGPFNYIQRVSFEQGVADALNPERSCGLAAAVEAALARETVAEIEEVRRVNIDAMEKRRSDLSRRTAALDAAGLAVVPKEPTVEMLTAGTEEWLTVRAMEDRAAVIWRAMLAAAKGVDQ